MNILISPNAFKGTMSAREAGGIIQDFIKVKFPQVNFELLPIADGGDGTCELLTELLDLEKSEEWSLDPYGRPIACSYGWDNHSHKAYIDVSAASGIALLGNEVKNPYVASSFGTGLLIRHAIDQGAEEIILGLGGSATVDLGVGILAALGVKFLDENGRELIPFAPNFLSKIRHIQKSLNIPKIRFLLLCDVKNMFLGERGAIPVFGPQKGLFQSQLKTFESDCEVVIGQLYRKQKLAFQDKPGFGAAGGIALGLSAFFKTDIKFGSKYFFEQVNLVEKVNWADFVITGEGRYDSQSTDGKACFELMQLAHSQSKKIALITSGEEDGCKLFDQVLTLPDLDFSKQDYLKRSRKNLRLLLELKFSLDF
ncbi:glycerate kinase [Algoriphagus ratkowskyi]|uniref:Glycerate kinase n=1 Tax=Algoriphagus ratkowskyi TaxID=57028 RepID=A0A2W7R4H7_9BACT|nr:glycerate kinase [Algoriphagus ratkowskyi]PZX55394.1 glycerate kinase [Algoriphagus ratkowskyi]TXD79681.1 glycerate kinase [Algoriphagus ratkowskyi]